MPSSFMAAHHTNPSTYSENSNVIHPQFYYPGANVPCSNPQQSLTNASLMALRHQIEDCNHEMVNMLTQQIGTVFNPLIQETDNSYLTLSDKMGRIADFFDASLVCNTLMPQNQNLRHVEGYVIDLITEFLQTHCHNQWSNHKCQWYKKESQYWFKGTKMLTI